jgi:ribosomal protein L29
MKRKEALNRFRQLSLLDLQKEIFDLEQKIQEQYFLLQLNKTKQVRLVRNLRRELARGLTIAHGQLRHVRKGNA